MSLQFNSKVAKESQPVRRNYLQAGIHEHCNLVEFGLKTTPNGTKYVSFLFEQEGSSEIAEHKVWYPRPETAQPREEETVEQAQQREVNNALSQVIHIVENVTMEEMPVITATTFEGWAEQAIARLTNKKKHQVKLKLIYDKNGQFATTPNRVPFVEAQEVNPTRLKFSKFEIENRLKKAEAPEATVSTSNDVDKLPF